MDAGITDSPLKPKGQPTYEIETDRSESERDIQELQKDATQQASLKQIQPEVDSEAHWIKKGGKDQIRI